MSDGQQSGGGSAAADALAGAGGGGGQQQGGSEQQQQQGGGQGGGGQGGGGQEQQQQGGGEPTWRDKFLSENLRGNEALANYKTIDDLATAHIETQKWARGRVAIPAADNVDAFTEFASKVRPEKAEEYKILGANGEPSEFGESFRSVFHDVGLHPIQAERLTAAWNQRETDILSKQTQAGRDDVLAVEMDLGPQAFNMRVAATDTMLKGLGIDIADIVPALEQVSGAGKALRALFTLAERTGELAKVDGATTQMRMGAMNASQANDEIDRMDKDPAIRAKVADKNSPEYAKRNQLMALVRKGD